MVQPSTPLDGVSSRAVLWVYALVIGPIGLFIALWGSAWIQGPINRMEYGIDSLVRIAGTILVGAACCAAGGAQIGDPRDRRRALGTLVLGHLVVFAMLLVQWKAIWPPGLGDWVLRATFVVTLLLLYAWLAANGDPSG